MSEIACSTCHQVYPADHTPFRCDCGAAFDYSIFPQFEIPQQTGKQGLHKYSQLLGLRNENSLVSLGEGTTPLLSAKINGIECFLKMESHNPTGSYKDRGTAVLVSELRDRGITSTVEDSSGNAGASFAAYCARAGIKARVYVPESASGPKRMQIEAYGAELVCVPGPRQEASKAVMQAVQIGLVYGSHAWMPFGLTGIATIAYEVVEQLGTVPETIIVPVGHGGLLYGIMRGFEAMFQSGVIDHEPYYLGVQSSGCAPLATACANNSLRVPEISMRDTKAEGVKVNYPVRGTAILKKLRETRGSIHSIEEPDLLSAWRNSAQQGIFMEPTSALAWAALASGLKDFKTPIVAVITGSGLKSSNL